MDHHFIRLVKNGNRQAFAQIVELYQDKMYYLCFRMLGNRQEAEDAVQEIFIRVYTHIERYDERQKFSTWIYRIANNLCIDILRKRKITYSLDSKASHDEDHDFYSILADKEYSLEQLTIVSEFNEHIQRVVQALPDKYRLVIVLKYMDELSLQEIGDILNITLSTVKTRLHRAREFLRKKLSSEIEWTSYF
jgi:RNA polymerase sigma-70 factor (ECF subfamily)